jgi:hypothetical protein
MRLMVCVETAGAEDGYDEDEIPPFAEHVDNIKELLRSGYYTVEYVDECRDNE